VGTSAGKQQPFTERAFDAVYDSFVGPGGFLEPGDYYLLSRDRYIQTLRYVAQIDLPERPRMLDIGGGQMAILTSKLLGFDAVLGDINQDFREPADKAGIGFTKCNLLDDDPPEFKGAFDLITLAEVVEHMPVPPYVVLRKVRTWLKPGGALLLTTPNMFRLRNIIMMMRGRDPFDRWRLPDGDVVLGHQTEYSAGHLAWQIREAGYTLERMEHDQLGHSGFSWKARMGRRLLKPLMMRKIHREELVAVARNPG